jgi:hypothetical protein
LARPRQWARVRGLTENTLRALFPRFVLTTASIGQAMLNLVRYGADKPVLEAADIYAVATRAAR